MKTYLLLPKIQVQNANALSSLCTIGFPAMTAWMGFAHALERKARLSSNLQTVYFSELGVISHSAHLQVYKKYGSEQYCIINSLNPNEKKPEKGKSNNKASFIEEPRIHLCVSLLIQCVGVSADNADELEKFVGITLHRMKIAGGDILSFETPKVYYMSDEEPEKEK